MSWLAKRIDYQTPMYNDSVIHRNLWKHSAKIANFYHNNLYSPATKDEGNEAVDFLMKNGFSATSQPSPYRDPHHNSSSSPGRPLENEWTLIRRDFQMFRFDRHIQPFSVGLEEIEAAVGSKSGVQVRIEAELTEFFYNNTQKAFAETRFIA